MVWKDGIDYYGYYVILGLKIWVDYFDKLMGWCFKNVGMIFIRFKE